MEQTILTSQQLKFLECVQSEPGIIKRFYLTGGTALAEFYLKHRLSIDIDLFTEKEEVNPTLTDAFLTKISKKLSIISINRSQFLGLVSYKLVYKDKETLKVDFNYYPFPRIAKGTLYKKLAIDSVYDIAANKVHTIFMKPRTRDYVDLYFILKKYGFSLQELIINAKAKFDWHIDRINLANQFIRVKDLKTHELPTMLVPFNQKEMETFFLSLARSLKKEIFK